MKNCFKIGIFAVLVIGMMIMSGCTSSTPVAAPVTTAPTTAAPVTTVAPVQTTQLIVQAAAAQTTPTAPDPILHRWVRQYPQLAGTVKWVGYEYLFYQDGTLLFNYGTPKLDMGNLQIIPSYEASGSWTKGSNNTYMVKYLPYGSTGAQIVEVYTWVPAGIDKEYGRMIPEHIVSQSETNQYKNSARELFADEMMYPERAKID